MSKTSSAELITGRATVVRAAIDLAIDRGWVVAQKDPNDRHIRLRAVRIDQIPLGNDWHLQ